MQVAGGTMRATRKRMRVRCRGRGCKFLRARALGRCRWCGSTARATMETWTVKVGSATQAASETSRVRPAGRSSCQHCDRAPLRHSKGSWGGRELARRELARCALRRGATDRSSELIHSRARVGLRLLGWIHELFLTSENAGHLVVVSLFVAVSGALLEAERSAELVGFAQPRRVLARVHELILLVGLRLSISSFWCGLFCG